MALFNDARSGCSRLSWANWSAPAFADVEAHLGFECRRRGLCGHDFLPQVAGGDRVGAGAVELVQTIAGAEDAPVRDLVVQLPQLAVAVGLAGLLLAVQRGEHFGGLGLHRPFATRRQVGGLAARADHVAGSELHRRF